MAILKHHEQYSVVDTGIVDGEIWHTIVCFDAVASWIRQNKTELFQEHKWYSTYGICKFDVSEELYFLIVLKFS